jgi:hypothetical protein
MTSAQVQVQVQAAIEVISALGVRGHRQPG